MRDEFVLKVYVFQKLQLGDATPDIMKNFQNIEVDVEFYLSNWRLRESRNARVISTSRRTRQLGRRRSKIAAKFGQ